MTVLSVGRRRDLLVMELAGGGQLVVACDSVGGIGPKPHDTFATSSRTVTHFAARVPILEVICAGATPHAIVDTLGVEREPSAADMIDEIRALARELGLDPDAAVNGSTEDNVDTVATSIGVTVIGSTDHVRIGLTEPDDEVYCIGIPLSAPGDALVPGDLRMPSIREVMAIAATPGVHELLPVGSHGIGWELDQLIGSALVADPVVSGLDLAATAGQSTCVLVSARPGTLTGLRPSLPLHLVAIARRP